MWLLCTGPVLASPVIHAGDIALRHDIQLLADHGILTGPVTTWPLSWGPVLADLERYESDVNEAAPVAAAIQRLKSRASWETRIRSTTFAASASAADDPMKIRGFENTPRESLQVGLGMDWTGERVAVSLNGQFADRSGGSTDSRVDGSMIGLVVGNWSVAVSTLDRWWGPGWDGSLVLSNNARPIPAVTFNRNFTDAFESRWLSWLGPWDFSVMMGQLESDRVVPDALFFGMRFNFRPLPSLEIGLSRTAQWCGDGRPCDASVFSDLLLGQDNIGDDNIGDSNEPGNQLAGIDFRWSLAGMSVPAAVYGQFIGEDEAGGFPSRYIGQFGVEAYGRWSNNWSWRWFGEFAGTSCQFYETSERFNCAYNHVIYQTGYRYRGRSIGHGADNDSRVVSTGIALVDTNESQWRAMIRSGTLNRGPGPDNRNSITPVPMDLTSIDLSHRRVFRFGLVEVGVGYEQTETSTGLSNEGPRFHVQWRSGY